jgi:transcriptional regulator with XRE-family HTH domain
MAGRTAPKPVRAFNLDFAPLRQLRRRDEISQVDLARAAGIHYATLWRLENNRYKNPSLKQLVSLARALGVPMYSLFTVIDPSES